MLWGSDWVRGEVWEFAASDVAAVLQTLDAIEGTNQPGYPNLYDRSVCQVRIDDEQFVDAYVYRYADTISDDRFIAPVDGEAAGVVKREAVWPPS